MQIISNESQNVVSNQEYKKLHVMTVLCCQYEITNRLASNELLSHW